MTGHLLSIADSGGYLSRLLEESYFVVPFTISHPSLRHLLPGHVGQRDPNIRKSSYTSFDLRSNSVHTFGSIPGERSLNFTQT